MGILHLDHNYRMQGYSGLIGLCWDLFKLLIHISLVPDYRDYCRVVLQALPVSIIEPSLIEFP